MGRALEGGGVHGHARGGQGCEQRGGETGGGDEGIDEEDAWEKQQAVQEVSGEAVFSKLHFASAGDEDYFPEVGNPLSFVAQRLNTLLASNPGVNLWQIVEKSLSQQQVQTLQAAGVRF